MEIKAGEFIRTNRIEKVERIDEEDWTCVITNMSAYNLQWLKNRNFKHSKNIIDLIEVGDFVNRKEVIEVRQQNGKVYLMTSYVPQEYIKTDIKSILTHEQYEQNEYRLEE